MNRVTYNEPEIGDSNRVVYQNENVNFTYVELQTVADRFGIGKITEEPTLEEGGLVNYNFVVKTGSGTYMVRAKNSELGTWEKDKMKLEHAVTDHLNNTDFPYQVPSFLSDISGERHLELSGKVYEVYERLPGEDCGPVEKLELTKAMARYHKAMEQFSEHKPEHIQGLYDERGWLYERYLELEGRLTSPQNELDQFMADSLPYLMECYRKLTEEAVPTQVSLAIHNDFSEDNVLCSDGSISGIIDFGNVRWGSKSQDLARLTKGEPSEVDNLIEEYRKHNPISDEEVANIVPEYVFGCLHAIRWMYDEMEKGNGRKLGMIKGRVGKLRQSMDNWNSN
ncbi:MAG: phosphotransferase [Nanoarchaeota archaeon]|nr:phosphotransferase [Nanoarchaeota archaeon]